MKRKILLICLSLILIFSFSGCSNVQNNENKIEDKIDVIEKHDNKVINENKSVTELKEDVIKETSININDFDKDKFIESCDFIHVISEAHETTKAEAVDGIQVKKFVYNVDNTHKIFVNSEVNENNYAGLVILKVGTNKVSDINRLNIALVEELDKDLYVVDVVKTPCCHYYIFRFKMPLTEDSITFGFGIDEYVTYYKLNEIEKIEDLPFHVNDSLFVEGSVVNLPFGNFIVSNNDRELVKDISTENEHIAIKQAVVELISLTGQIKIDNFDDTKWGIIDFNGNLMNEYKDELGGNFTYTITVVSPEYRNKFNNDLAYSVYVTYKYINEDLTGDSLEKQMDKIISNTFLSYMDNENEFFRDFAIN